MLRILKSKIGQNTAEYAILVALVVAAVVGMQTYVKRGIQAKVKDAGSDFSAALDTQSKGAMKDISQNPNVAIEKQYEDANLTSYSTQRVLEDTQVYDLSAEGQATRDITRRTQQAPKDFQKSDYDGY